MPFSSPRRRLLIVDDEPGIVERMRTHFEVRYEVDTATSPTSAIERFEAQRPDVVFLEIGRQGADGIMLLTYLRDVDPRVAVIVVTANPSSMLAAECVKAGAFGYVPKPLNLVYLDHLAALAADQLAGRRAG